MLCSEGIHSSIEDETSIAQSSVFKQQYAVCYVDGGLTEGTGGATIDFVVSAAKNFFYCCLHVYLLFLGVFKFYGLSCLHSCKPQNDFQAKINYCRDAADRTVTLQFCQLLLRSYSLQDNFYERFAGYTVNDCFYLRSRN